MPRLSGPLTSFSTIQSPISIFCGRPVHQACNLHSKPSMRATLHRVLIAACAAVIISCALIACATLDPNAVKQQSGYYYGFGSGATKSDAAVQAKRDLISNALTETARSRGIRKGRIVVDAQVAAAFALPKLDPIAKSQADGQETVALSIKSEEWEKYERARETAVRAELQPRLVALRDAERQHLADRLSDAGRMLDRLAREGLTDLLTETEQGSLLLSDAVETFCREAAVGLSITIHPRSGFIDGSTRFEVEIRNADGAPAGSLPLRAEWTPRDAAPGAAADSVTATSGPDGRLALSYPAGESFRNTGVRLAVATDLARAAPSSAALKDADSASRVEAVFRHFDDFRKFFGGEVLVPGGPFTAGAVAQDRRATRKEAARQASTTAFSIDLVPVTNAMYQVYLEDTNAETVPDYLDNPRFDQPDQPIVGVSYDDAVRFASWLSAKLGVVKRLPTEDEWEKAARGGKDIIYPWGDESPTDGVRANFNGNGRFSSPSPVGSFAAGRNAYGLSDMAGNVWQWTSTSRAAGSTIVKGGSWMDGPTDLRISNRREVDPGQGYADVGFRLVREVNHE